MIVVVKSNFVLELAFRQEEVSQTERIMTLAAEKAIELAIPACALALAESVQTEAAALDRAILRILDCARVIPLSDAVLRSSFRARTQFPFGPQDSVVFASADWYLNECGRAESVFANKNSTDFALAEVKAHFSGLNCRLLSTFADALGVISHRARAGQE